MANDYSNQVDDAPEASEPMDFRSIYYSLLERLWLIVLCLVAAAFVTIGYLKRAPKIYSAQAVLKADPDDAKVMRELQDLMSDESKGQEYLKTLERLLQSRALFERVIATNNLDKDARFVRQLEGLRPSRAELVAILGTMVKVNVQMGTRLLNISVEHTDPRLTAQIANSLVQEFARQAIDQQSIAFQAKNEWLIAKEIQLRKEMEESEKAVLAFKNRNISLDEGQDIVVQAWKSLSQQLSEAKAELLRRETEYEQIHRSETNVEALLRIPIVAGDPAVMPLLGRIAVQELEFGNLKLRYKEKHPKYIDVASQLAELRTALTNATLKVIESVRSTHDSAKSRVAGLEKQLEGQKQTVHELNDLAVQYKVKSREAEEARTLHETVQKALMEASLIKDVPNSNVRLVQPAYVPEKPIKPEKVKILMAGVMLGLMTGVGLAMGLYALDSSLKSPEQAEDCLKIPLLATIPQVREVKAGKKHFIMTEATECYESENFRTLRTTLAMLGPEADRRTFLFTSALPNEGKTFCALNYALSLAQQGLRTVFIEGDLRCPSVAGAILHEVQRSPGVTDFLAGRKPFNELTQSSGIENLAMIPAGTPAPNPSELLSRNGFGELIESALAHFDRVVVDSAPVHPVSDALLMVKHVQSVCLVVRANSTPKKLVMSATETLIRSRAPLVGFLFNGISRNRVDYYSDYSYQGAYAGKEVG